MHLEMASKLVLLIAFCLIQGTWSYPNPATSGTTTATVSTETGTGTSAGAKLSSNFKKNLASILGNTQSGISSLTTPMIKMAVDTGPKLINSGVQTVAQKVAKLSEANKENSAKIASGIGKAVGGGATLGSAVAGGLMQVAGGGIDAFGKIVDSGATGALSMGGQLADSGINGLGTLASLGEGFLDTAGDGLSAAGGGVTVFTNGVTKTVEAISDRMAQSIKNAADTMTKLMQEQESTTNANVVAAATALRTRAYNAMNSYLTAVAAMQNVFESLMATVSNTASTDGTGTTTTTVAAST